MAKVTFNPDQPVQSLSGTLGALTFRTINGRTHVFQRAEPELPKHPTRQQRAQFKQRTIINQCITILQDQYEDIREAMTMRPTIKDRLTHLYKKHVTDIKSPTKLQRTIMSEYYARFSSTSSGQYRCNIGPLSVHSRKITTQTSENQSLNPTSYETYNP